MRLIDVIKVGMISVLAASTGTAVPQTSRPCPSAETFLPPGNVRNSEAGVVRIYKVDADKKFGRQPPGYPKTIADPTRPIAKAADEEVRMHEGVDYSSYDLRKRPSPLEFRAGVYGTVADPPRKGFIAVRVDEAGNRVEYLHNSSVAPGIVRGAKVTPKTILGRTGNINPATGKPLAGMGIHLHVQARNKDRQPLNPCEVVEYASKPYALRKEAPFFVPLDRKHPVSLVPVNWEEFKDDAGTKPRETLFFDENAPKKK